MSGYMQGRRDERAERQHDLSALIAKAVARELRYWVQINRPWRDPDDPSAPTAQAAHFRDAKALEMRATELDPNGEWPSIAYPAKPPTEVPS